MHSKRLLNLTELIKKKSFFLLGARSTGKTTLIKEQLAETVCFIDLLRSEYFLRLSSNPEDLEAIISASNKSLVVIDEIQKLPFLLNEVHRIIEEKKIKFILTGSSARKIKNEHANMLGGRAWQANLYPLISEELKEFDLDRYLLFGGLPHVYYSKYPEEELDAYVSVYLKEEIQIEGVTRNLNRFSRFLNLAAHASCEVINFSNIANDAGCAPSTVIEYFRILEDTLLGFFVEPLGASKKRKEISAAKFYLFDIGVTNTLARIKSIERSSNLYGRAFEQFIAMELRAAISYLRKSVRLSYWRTYEKHEVDFVIEDICAIEVKATTKASERDAKSLAIFAEENKVKKYYLVTQDPVERITKNVQYIYYKNFLNELWNGQIIT